MRKIILLTLVAVLALASGCGGSDDDKAEGNGKVRTTSSGLKIIEANDSETGLHLEIQGDSVYIEPTGKTPADLRKRLTGHGLGGHCEGKPGQTIPGLATGFPIYWRARFGDWGSALARTQETKPVLAEVLVSCKIYAAGSDDQVRIGGSNKPVATIDLR